ncbi:Retrotransposon-derived protein PEG10, partial [Bienertia sinuspersici]
MCALMATKGKKYQGGENFRDYQKEKQEKMKLRCDYCGKRGHVQGGCFELNGFPEWYKSSRPRGKLPAHVERTMQRGDIESPLDDHDDEGLKPDPQIVSAVVKEVMKVYGQRAYSSSSKGQEFEEAHSYALSPISSPEASLGPTANEAAEDSPCPNDISPISNEEPDVNVAPLGPPKSATQPSPPISQPEIR